MYNEFEKKISEKEALSIAIAALSFHELGGMDSLSDFTPVNGIAVDAYESLVNIVDVSLCHEQACLICKETLGWFDY